MFECVLDGQDFKVVFVNEVTEELKNGKIYNESVFTKAFPQYFIPVGEVIVEATPEVEAPKVIVLDDIIDTKEVLLVDESSDVSIQVDEDNIFTEVIKFVKCRGRPAK